VRPIVLCAGLGTRLRPATFERPKALFRFLNVPLVDRRLRSLARQGFPQVAINLHHEGRQIVEHLGESGAAGPAIRFFWEPVILGTAGAVKNAEAFFEHEEAAVWNVDAELDADLGALRRAHRRDGNAATLLVTRNPDPGRFTPLEAEGSRLVSIGTAGGVRRDLVGGGAGERPLLFTGVSILAPRAIERIPRGTRSLVDDLWRPLLAERRERIGVVFHEGSYFDLGTPADVVAAAMAALESGRDFDAAEGFFEGGAKVLAGDPETIPAGVGRSVVGRARIARDARVEGSVLLDGADIGRGSIVTGCLVGPVRVEPGEMIDGMFLWPGEIGVVRIPLHDSSQRRAPAV
jgi:mannose-1-phosphate guanylyltransferase